MKINDFEKSTTLQNNDETSNNLFTNEEDIKTNDKEINSQNSLKPLNTTNLPKKEIFVKAKISFSCQLCHENFSNKIELVQHEQIHINKYFTHETKLVNKSNGILSVEPSKIKYNDPNSLPAETIRGEEQFACSSCEKAFSKISSMKIH